MLDTFLTLAQGDPQVSEEGLIAMMAALGFVLVLVLLVALVIYAIVTYFLWSAMKRVPEQYQQLSPGVIWVLNFPIINIVGLFFITSKLSGSLKSFFDANDVHEDIGDAGKGIGLGWAICVACSLIPFIGGLAGLAGLVLMILYLVKVTGLKNRIPENAGGGGGAIAES